MTERGPKVTKATLNRYRSQITARLSQIRGDRSQRIFARELGVFRQNINRYENGTTPHADFLITLALKENVSLDWLLLGRGKPRRRG
ncbi:MAG: helix-turn-helix domain-containing protein [Nitrospirales bacterium]